MFDGAQRDKRRTFGIRGYVGPNGHGKSMLAIHDLLPSLEQGRPVLSTARLLDYLNPRMCEDSDCRWPGHPEHGQAHPLWVPFERWEDLLMFEGGEVFMDEVAGVASSREHGSLPFQVARELQKLRKRDVTLTYTAPAWARCELIIRECTTLLTECRGSFAVKAFDEDGALKVWRRRRFFSFRSYDPIEFQDFTAGVKEKIRPVVRDRLWITHSPAYLAYDSSDFVLSLGWANDSGLCMECGGNRPRPRCSCGAPAPRGRRPAARQGEDDGTEGSPRRAGAISGGGG